MKKFEVKEATFSLDLFVFWARYACISFTCDQQKHTNATKEQSFKTKLYRLDIRRGPIWTVAPIEHYLIQGNRASFRFVLPFLLTTSIFQTFLWLVYWCLSGLAVPHAIPFWQPGLCGCKRFWEHKAFDYTNIILVGGHPYENGITSQPSGACTLWWRSPSHYNRPSSCCMKGNLLKSVFPWKGNSCSHSWGCIHSSRLSVLCSCFICYLFRAPLVLHSGAVQVKLTALVTSTYAAAFAKPLKWKWSFVPSEI